MYKVYVDSAANIPASLVTEYDINVIPFINLVDGKEVPGFIPGLTLEEEREKGKEYYDLVRNGAKVKTSLISIGKFTEIFEEELKAGYDVLYFSLSHGISGNFNSAKLAAESLNDEYENNKVYLVDSLNASLAQGNLAIYATVMRNNGISVQEAQEVLQRAASQMNGVFTVDDLKYLSATGRLHGGVAVVGQMLKIKPLLKGNSEGYIVSFQKCRGRKKSLRALAELVAENAVLPERQILGIAHADCYEESLKVIEMIEEKVHFKQIINTSYDFCTGSHVGPGTIALFFLAEDRELEGQTGKELEIYKYI